MAMPSGGMKKSGWQDRQSHTPKKGGAFAKIAYK
jgi:hypothetical protein